MTNDRHFLQPNSKFVMDTPVYYSVLDCTYRFKTLLLFKFFLYLILLGDARSQSIIKYYLKYVRFVQREFYCLDCNIDTSTLNYTNVTDNYFVFYFYL